MLNVVWLEAGKGVGVCDDGGWDRDVGYGCGIRDRFIIFIGVFVGTESLTMPVTFSKTSPVLSLLVVWLPILTPPLDPDIPKVSARPAPPETMLCATRALF